MNSTEQLKKENEELKEYIAITPNLDEKTVSKCKGYDEAIPITDKELQAISKKVKELGWID